MNLLLESMRSPCEFHSVSAPADSFVWLRCHIEQLYSTLTNEPRGTIKLSLWLADVTPRMGMEALSGVAIAVPILRVGYPGWAGPNNAGIRRVQIRVRSDRSVCACPGAAVPSRSLPEWLLAVPTG